METSCSVATQHSNVIDAQASCHSPNGVSPSLIASNYGHDGLPVDPRFLELHEELRHVVFDGIANLSPSRWPTPDLRDREEQSRVHTALIGPGLDLSSVTVSRIRLIRYLQNWVTECAPILDKFDANRHFQIQVPLIARDSPTVLYAVLAFSSRQMERRKLFQESICDSIELYQESIRRLSPSLQAKDPNILVAACLLAVFELMSWSSTDWKRHLEGCATLFQFFDVNGLSGGLAQALFWCYARMDVCGAIISEASATLTLPLTKWTTMPPASVKTPAQADDFAQASFKSYSIGSVDMYANWAVFLCAQVCDLRFRRARRLESGASDTEDDRPLSEQWQALWSNLRGWIRERPPAMVPHVDERSEGPFPTVLFSHWAAISSTQLYHTACILMIDMWPSGYEETPTPETAAIWHARRICGISCTNPHKPNLINSIQLLYVAGRLLTHPTERIEITKLLRRIDRDAGWGAWWRLRDLEAEWGCEYRDMIDMAE